MSQDQQRATKGCLITLDAIENFRTDVRGYIEHGAFDRDDEHFQLLLLDLLCEMGISSLRSETASRDTERLDWLSKADFVQIQWHGSEPVNPTREVRIYGSQARKAIDAAMGAQPAVTETATLTRISAEVERARTKHPQWPEDSLHAAGVVAEESGELIRAAVQHRLGEGGTLDACDKEAIQTAATCVRFLERR